MYEMPSVSLGQRVLWYEESDLNSSPKIGVVTAKGNGTLALTIMHPGAVSLQCADGVRHVSDPNKREETKFNGLWDFTEGDKKRLKMEQRLADLEAMVKGMVKK